mmetsp:Transcript_122825/g.306785  ORF Transcript_122825/g.306785 Transcript_122825/m.306785 type:complete len:171 (-) Transcript_122825:120-632(-)
MAALGVTATCSLLRPSRVRGGCVRPGRKHGGGSSPCAVKEREKDKEKTVVLPDRLKGVAITGLLPKPCLACGYFNDPRNSSCTACGQLISPGLEAEPEESVPDLRAWLRTRSLLRHFEAVDKWCVDMGATDIFEVMDNVESIAEHLGDALTWQDRANLLRDKYKPPAYTR